MSDPAATPQTTDGAPEERQLSPRERRFVEEYCANGFRQTEAARTAGYRGSDKGIRVTAYRLVRTPHIAAAIDATLAELADGARLRAEAILLELAKIGFSDIGEVLDFSGEQPRLKPAKDIPVDARQAIESIKVKRFTEGRGEDSDQVEVTEFKLHDKLGALEKLGRYRRLFVDRTALENPDGTPVRFTLAIGDQGDRDR